jgi:hypothetical protein
VRTTVWVPVGSLRYYRRGPWLTWVHVHRLIRLLLPRGTRGTLFLCRCSRLNIYGLTMLVVALTLPAITAVGAAVPRTTRTVYVHLLFLYSRYIHRYSPLHPVTTVFGCSVDVRTTTTTAGRSLVLRLRAFCCSTGSVARTRHADSRSPWLCVGMTRCPVVTHGRYCGSRHTLRCLIYLSSFSRTADFGPDYVPRGLQPLFPGAYRLVPVMFPSGCGRCLAPWTPVSLCLVTVAVRGLCRTAGWLPDFPFYLLTPDGRLLRLVLRFHTFTHAPTHARSAPTTLRSAVPLLFTALHLRCGLFAFLCGGFPTSPLLSTSTGYLPGHTTVHAPTVSLSRWHSVLPLPLYSIPRTFFDRPLVVVGYRL